MDVFTAIRERRSCRNFLPDLVDEDAIEKILEAAIWAPSPLNMQGWKFIVITNQEIKEKIYWGMHLSPVHTICCGHDLHQWDQDLSYPFPQGTSAPAP
jgi:nitroreductase